MFFPSSESLILAWTRPTNLTTRVQAAVAVVSPDKYIQHNLGVGDGLAGFGKVVANAPAGGFKAEVMHMNGEDYFYMLFVDESDSGNGVSWENKLYRIEGDSLILVPRD